MTVASNMTPDPRVALLEERFRTIQRERMAGMTVLHPGLRVEAVGFRHWHGYTLGVLVTPWFMSLMLLPSQADEWLGLSQGSVQRFIFPAGEYDFVLAEEPELGHYRSCSLFSPMAEFADQTQAVATATAIMDGLFRDAAEQPSTVSAVPEPRPSARPVSRRGLLFGAFRRDKQ